MNNRRFDPYGVISGPDKVIDFGQNKETRHTCKWFRASFYDGGRYWSIDFGNNPTWLTPEELADMLHELQQVADKSKKTTDWAVDTANAMLPHIFGKPYGEALQYLSNQLLRLC